MLTRKGIRDADEEIAAEAEDIDWDEAMSLSDAQLNKLEKELDAELLELERIYQRKLAQMDPLTRYRFQRRRILISILRSRERGARWKKIGFMEMALPMNRDYIRKKQKDLVSIRYALRTGLDGGRA